MAESDDDADRNSEKKINEKSQKLCAYCNKKVVESIKCAKCCNVYHKSCASTRVKGFKLITSEVGLCCYREDKASENLMFIIALVKENEAKQTEINLLQKLNMEMDEKNLLQKEKISNLEKNSWGIKSYADVTNKQTLTKQPILNNITNTSIVIRPKKPQNITKTKTELDQNVNPCSLNIGIKKMKATKTGSIVISCATKQESEVLKKEVEKKLGNSYEIGETKLRKPRIKITEFDKNLNETEILNSIRNQNKFIEENEEIKVTYVKRSENRRSVIFAECSPSLFSKFMSLKKIYIGWQRYPIYEDLSLPRCFNCQEYFHKTTNCRNKKVCKYCSEEHDEKDCLRQTKKCKNCENANSKYKTKYNLSHDAQDQECPTFKYHLEILKSKIDYGLLNG